MTPAEPCQPVQGRGTLSLTTIAPWSLWWPQGYSKSFFHCTAAHTAAAPAGTTGSCVGELAWIIQNSSLMYNTITLCRLYSQGPPMQTDYFLIWRLCWFMGRSILSGLGYPVTPAQRKTLLPQASPPCNVLQSTWLPFKTSAPLGSCFLPRRQMLDQTCGRITSSPNLLPLAHALQKGCWCAWSAYIAMVRLLGKEAGRWEEGPVLPTHAETSEESH